MDNAKAPRLAVSGRRFLFAAMGALALAALLLAFRDGGDLGQSIRRPAADTLQILAVEDYPDPIENIGAWSVRLPANPALLNPAFAEAVHFIMDSRQLVAAAFSAETEARPPQILAPVLAQDNTASPALMASLPFGYSEPLDSKGQPLRWRVPKNVLASYNVARPMPFQAPQKTVNPQFEAALARLAPSRSAADYRALVESFASRYGLNTNLVMAIIHSESNFTPTLVSSKSAMGLMQLLPSTASDEVHRFLYGRRGQVSFEQLAVPEINIRYGTAYLHLLYSRYFANVHDRQVREACVIASYNMGPNGFLRLYGRTPEDAIAKINSMGSDEFHDDLPRRLPMRETRFYVEKVRRMKQHYAGMQ